MLLRSGKSVKSDKKKSDTMSGGEAFTLDDLLSSVTGPKATRMALLWETVKLDPIERLDDFVGISQPPPTVATPANSQTMVIIRTAAADHIKQNKPKEMSGYKQLSDVNLLPFAKFLAVVEERQKEMRKDNVDPYIQGLGVMSPQVLTDPLMDALNRENEEILDIFNKAVGDFTTDTEKKNFLASTPIKPLPPTPERWTTRQVLYLVKQHQYRSFIGSRSADEQRVQYLTQRFKEAYAFYPTRHAHELLIAVLNMLPESLNDIEFSHKVRRRAFVQMLQVGGANWRMLADDICKRHTEEIFPSWSRLISSIESNGLAERREEKTTIPEKAKGDPEKQKSKGYTEKSGKADNEKKKQGDQPKNQYNKEDFRQIAKYWNMKKCLACGGSCETAAECTNPAAKEKNGSLVAEFFTMRNKNKEDWKKMMNELAPLDPKEKSEAKTNEAKVAKETNKSTSEKKAS
jgi:hypothetical protein